MNGGLLFAGVGIGFGDSDGKEWSFTFEFSDDVIDFILYWWWGSMNIVKGVADLIRRTSTGQTGESASGSQAQRLSPPGPKIRFRYLFSVRILINCNLVHYFSVHCDIMISV